MGGRPGARLVDRGAGLSAAAPRAVAGGGRRHRRCRGGRGVRAGARRLRIADAGGAEQLQVGADLFVVGVLTADLLLTALSFIEDLVPLEIEHGLVELCRVRSFPATGVMKL